MGSLAWMTDQRLPTVMIASQQKNADYMMRHRLGDRYVRIDRVQSREQERHLALDVATAAAKKDLRGLAEASAREALALGSVQRMLRHTPAEPRFFHARAAA
jgi:hypothetical protein